MAQAKTCGRARRRPGRWPGQGWCGCTAPCLSHHPGVHCWGINHLVLSQRAVGVVRLGRRPGRPEYAEHAHLAGADVLEAMHQAGGQMHACPRAERRGLTVDVQLALALQDVDDLVVFVKVIGRADDGDVSNELRYRPATELRRREQTELAA